MGSCTAVIVHAHPDRHLLQQRRGILNTPVLQCFAWAVQVLKFAAYCSDTGSK